LAAALAAVGAAAAAPDARWRDVLDTPAAKSALAAKGLLVGLAKAGSRLVAVGQRGHVVYSDDGGTTWQQADVPVASDLVAVHFPDDRNGWAVGHDGVILHSADGGRSWQRQRDGRADGAQGAENPWLDVWFADARNGWVVGAFGTMLCTKDGGTTWQPLAHPLDNPKGLHLYAVRGVGADVYVVGEQGMAFRLDRGPAAGRSPAGTDPHGGSPRYPAAGGEDSERFVPIELPYKGTLFGVVGNARAVVVHGLRGNALRSADGGRTWTSIPTGLQVGLTASAVDAKGRIVFASQAGHVLVSADDGASFAPARLERPVPAAAVIAAAGGTLVVAGPRGVQPIALP
jgi:photosystem II stability/assembly factor-like uncharacterized protein